MNRLQSELERLYVPRPQGRVEADVLSTALIDASGRVRAMVMELTRPPDWEALSRVWRGVQVELELPAPAIAVSGIDGLQLWFSITEPIAVAQAHDFLERLRQRFLADIETNRVRLMPASSASKPRQDFHAALVPARQEDGGNWSAFLAPDLVPVFAESPWLDIPPNEEGQATLLRGIEAMTQSAFEAAFTKLGPTQHAPSSNVAAAASVDASMAFDRPKTASADGDPEKFLLQIMTDETVALALRIEAAKALLQHANKRPLQQGD
ncbi:MAG: hypothetical protein ABI434_02470 [Burkholderiaceae bacterium]